MGAVRSGHELHVEQLVEEQRALRRVATLMAEGAAAEALFAVVAEEISKVLRVPLVSIVRYEADDTATGRASFPPQGAVFEVGTRWSLDGPSVVADVLESSQPARIDDYCGLTSEIAEACRRAGIRSSVGNPIVVATRLWGVMVVSSLAPDVLAAGTEARLAEFTELVATAIANSEARDEVRRLADEQAALRRVAMLVARRTGPEPVFHAVADEAGALLDCDTAAIVRFESDGTATVMGAHNARRAPGEPFEPDPRYLIASVRATGRTARFDTDDPTADGMPEPVRTEGIRSALASPIVVDGELWGTITVASLARPLADRTEHRLADFTELVATAISNAQAREDLRRLAAEQSALRRVATLVAREASQTEVFTAIAEEAGQLLGSEDIRMYRYDGDHSALVVGAWGYDDFLPVGSRHPLGGSNSASLVFRTRGPARIDDYATTASGAIGDTARSSGIRSVVATPILVQGRLWGAMAVGTGRDEPLPADTEVRLGQFTELMATAISNAEARSEVERLAAEQAALRRVATLVARGIGPEPVFDAVAEEARALLDCDNAAIVRFEADGTVIALGAHNTWRPAGVRVQPDPGYLIATVRATGHSARFDTDDPMAPGMPEAVRAEGTRSALASPIVVDGDLWGAMAVGRTKDGALPPETESRLAQFTELMATAIANTESRARADRLTDEQTTLRRLATLVAQEAPLDEVFTMVAEEAAKTFDDADAALWRDSGDGTAVAVAVRGASVAAGVPVGTRLSLDGDSVIAMVLRDGRPHRISDYSRRTGPFAERARELGLRSAVGCPIVVGSRTWGVIAVATYEATSFGPETEARVSRFGNLVATAIANADARAEVERLAAEQAALRRVATLVAEGGEPGAVFDAVAAEMEALLGSDQVSLARYEPGDEVTIVAHRGTGASLLPPGSRLSMEGQSVTATVRRTEQSARIEDFERADGPIAAVVRAMGMRVSVGAPVVVEGRLWGVITARWRNAESPPADTEQRMALFAQLLDTAIANADSRDQLTSSRTRLLTAADDARRRLVRDLHDGAQQRLVHTIIAMQLAHNAVRDDDAGALVSEALEHAKQANAELRELAHGILPAVLTNGGLHAAISSVVARLDLAVEVDVPRERFPAEIEASAYFIAAEALTNVVKHASARRARVAASIEGATLRLEVHDDGIGGADAGGHGLLGVRDRVTALGGRLEIDSPAGAGTLLAATLPFPA